jgi:hypothetical protein
VAPVNLIMVTPDGKIHPTEYLGVLYNAVSEIYGEYSGKVVKVLYIVSSRFEYEK